MTDDRHDERLDDDGDALRRRLRHIDPVPESMSVESPTSASARTRWEHIMTTDTTSATNLHHTSTSTRSPWRRPTWVLAAAAAAVLLAAAGIVATNLGDDTDDEPMATPPLVLDLGESDALASCLPFDVNVLATMSPAFAATATAVDVDVVTLDVDRWYAGGDAEVVQLRAVPGHAALIAGFDVEVGEQYLITASEGTVNFCGYSGPATAEFTAQFDQAFAGG